VSHTLSIPDVERAAQLIEQYTRLHTFPSQSQTVLTWLNSLPDELVCSHPTLCIIHALVLMFAHQWDKTASRLGDTERCLQEEMPVEKRRAIEGQVAVIRGSLARLSGNTEQCISLSRQALELLPETEIIPCSLMFRSGAVVNLTYTYLLDGDVTEAREHSVEAAMLSIRVWGNLPTMLRSVSNVVRLQMMQGRLRKAAATNEQALHLIASNTGLQNSEAYYINQGELLREWNQLESAEQHLMHAVESVRETLTVDADVVMRGHMALACLQTARGESSLALATLDEFAKIARRYNFATHLVAYGEALRARIELAQGNLAVALLWVDGSGLSTHDQELSYPYEQGYLTLARVRITQARADSKSQDLSDVFEMLARLLKDAESKKRMRSALEILILLALARQVVGDHAGSLAALERALGLAEPEGYIRCFADEGPYMVALLTRFKQQHRTNCYVERLLAAFPAKRTVGTSFPGREGGSATHRSRQTLLDPLSERELEVLHLLARGVSNREIAEVLVMAPGTAKLHVSNILSKLGARNRTQAVMLARELGLLME